MIKQALTGAVGNPAGMGNEPVNIGPDVDYVRWMLYKTLPAEGGPEGKLQLDVCDPRTGAVKIHDLADAILKFQMAQKRKNATWDLFQESWHGEETAGGRVMKGSQTLKLLQRRADEGEDANRSAAARASAQTADTLRRGAMEDLKNWKPDDYPATTVKNRDLRLPGCPPAGKYLLQVDEKTPLALAIKWVCDQYDALDAPLALEIFAHGYESLMSETDPMLQSEKKTLSQGGGGIVFCKEDITIGTVLRFRPWRGKVKSIVLHSCGAAYITPGSAGGPGDGNMLCSQLAMNSGATVQASTATQHYAGCRSDGHMDFPKWEGSVFTYGPDGKVIKVE